MSTAILFSNKRVSDTYIYSPAGCWIAALYTGNHNVTYKLSLCALSVACLAPLCHANMSVYPMSVDINDLGEGSARVKFEAVPQLDDPLAGAQQTKSQLIINLIWGVLVSVPPEHPQLKMSLLPDGKITNTGNQRFKLLKVGLCKKSQPNKECVWQDVGNNIYPRASYTPKNILNYERVVVQYWNWIDKTKHSQDFSIH
jgi:hypothetical protein